MPAQSNALFTRQREAGGLPGIIKMFSYLPLAALYIIVARDLIREEQVFNNVKTRRYKTYICILLVLLTVLIRSVFTLDRGLVCAAFIIIFYYAVFNADKYYTCRVHSKRNMLLLASVLAVTIVFSHLLSYVRQGIGFKDVLAQYSSLGLCSLSLMFNSDFDYSFGFESGQSDYVSPGLFRPEPNASGLYAAGLGLEPGKISDGLCL
jgi:hypothetical protein